MYPDRKSLHPCRKSRFTIVGPSQNLSKSLKIESQSKRDQKKARMQKRIATPKMPYFSQRKSA
jgi:hypothetical protein